MNRLDSQEEVKTLKSLGMLQTLDMFPSRCGDAIQLGDEFEWESATDIDRIVVRGLGRSAMSGEGASARIFSQGCSGDYVCTCLAFPSGGAPVRVALIKEFEAALAQQTTQLEGER